MVKVIKAKNEMVVGVEGIVIRETTRTFVVIQEDNSVKVLLKVGTVFQFRLPIALKAKTGESLAVNIWGDNIL